MDAIESLYTRAADSAESSTPPKVNELGQDEFLSLMLAQLKHQDPLKPLENGEFVAQMAQFSTVSGIENMNKSVQQLAESLTGNQLLQSSSMIGRQALVPGDDVVLQENQNALVHYQLPENATDITLRIHNASGELVQVAAIGSRQTGTHSFDWDGSKSDGSTAAPGIYTASITYAGQQGESSASIYKESRITSINTLSGGTGFEFETESGETLSLQDIIKLK